MLFLTAAVTGLLVPYINNQRQNHEKELELKTNLASNVSETPSRVVAAAMLYASGRYTQGAFIQELASWISSSAIIESELTAYYANSSVAER
jgi:hypothetical protein